MTTSDRTDPTASSDELRIGTLVAGKYRLERPLGQGAYGTVWRARQENVRRPVAVKFLHATLDDTARRRFEREAKALALLDHPNCVVLYDYGHHGSQAFLVTEYLDGITLHEWMRGDRALVEILDVTYQLLDALSHAHREHVVHRDLKPGNIIIVPGPAGSNRVVVLDFGIASMSGERRGDITKTGELFGTPGFMSPEQLSGDAGIGPAADLYALGVILYTMLEKRPPFRAKTPIEAVLKHLTDEAPPLQSDVPEELKRLVAQLLAKEPNDRPGSARAVQAALPRLERPSGFIAAEPSGSAAPPLAMTPPVHAAPPPQVPQRVELTPPASPNTVAVPRWILQAVGAVGLVALGAGVMYLALDRPPAAVPAPARALPSALVTPVATAPAHAATPVAAEADAGGTSGSPGCGAAHPGTGLRTVSVTIDTLDRAQFRAWIPAGYDPARPHAVAMLLHDTLQTPDQLLGQLGVAELADRDGVVIVLPEDPVVLNAWRSRDSHDRARRTLQVASEALCLDLDRVLLYGHGGGGLAAEELSCALDGVRAVAVSAHRLGEGQRPCQHRGVPYLLLAPLEDGRDPVEGGVGCLGGAAISLQAHEETYKRLHGCHGDDRIVFEHRHGRCRTWECDAPFTSCRVQGGRPLPTGSANIECEGEAVAFPYGERLWELFRGALHAHELDE